MELTIRPALLDDASLLAKMNRELADDEHSRNNMTLDALAVRMQKWLSEDWQGVVFEQQGNTVGYAIYQIGSDYYEPTIPEVYVRQFFVVRERRNGGLGRKAFVLLTKTIFPPASRVHLDVLATNPDGQRFWKALGFQPYSTAMRLTP